MTARRSITSAQRLRVLKSFGALVLCQVCANSVYIRDIQIDHELALIDSGKHCPDTNLRPVCFPCHSRKSAREHKNNAKVKRIVRKRSEPKQPGSIKSRGFDKQWRKTFSGKVEKRT